MGDIIEFPFGDEDYMDLTHVDRLSDEKLFEYQEEIYDMIISGLNDDALDFLDECMVALLEEGKKRFFKLKQ